MNAKDLDAKHPEHSRLAGFWEDITLLHEGGCAVLDNITRFLVQRPREPKEVYAARAKRASYQNILGTVLGWYVSRLFSDELRALITEGGSPPDDRYYAHFLADADRRGHSMAELARTWFLNAVLHGATYVLVDLPAGPLAPTRRAQREAGGLDPFLVTFEAPQLLNWQCDERDEFDWVVLATEVRRADFGRQPLSVDRWYYFDREIYRMFEAARETGQGRGADTTATLVAEGRHAMADRRRVPLLPLVMPKPLWLGYRVYPQVLDHLNQDNSLAWALFMGNLAVPVITGDYDEPPVVSETAYIKLERHATFGWAEPAGTSYEHSSRRVQMLREEIYRQMYLQAQGRSTQATAAAASGYSKELDMAPATEVLNGFGAIMRQFTKSLLQAVAEIRGDAHLSIDVVGMNFPERDALAEIETAEAALSVGIPSPTYERYVLKRIAGQYATNANPDTLRRIEEEIEASPTPSERAAQQRERQEQLFSEAL